MNLRAVYGGKTVLVTGNTGFKGSWLTAWLLHLGARVVGIAKDVPTNPAMFEELGLADRIAHHRCDVRDLGAVREIFARERPDFVIHLAAQAIVLRSFTEPAETVSTNVLGTMHVLEVLRHLTHPCAAVLITSDKCYDNAEWVWGYRETDRLGGKDIYSGSKAAAEMVIRSYLASFFEQGTHVRIAVGRAGNVIGGGDWARDRIVADCARAWSNGRSVEIRSPNATRPWQHVLEPLSGYLTLGAALAAGPEQHGEAFNFGPSASQDRTVIDLIRTLAEGWTDFATSVRAAENAPFAEAGLLRLNCDKAHARLAWEPNLCFEETIRLVRDWYQRYYSGGGSIFAHTLRQIEEYEELGRQRRRVWASV